MKLKQKKLVKLIKSQEFDLNQDRYTSSSTEREHQESFRLTQFQRAGGGRRVIRKKIGGE